MMNHVLNPCEVGVSRARRNAVFPTLVFSQTLTTPVFHIEGGIREDVVSAYVRVEIIVESVAVP